MQREIKFRVFDIDNKIMNPPLKFAIRLNGEVFVDQDDWRSHPKNYLLIIFTGLKDKNGIDIYEGDLIECPSKWRGIVYWSQDELQWWVNDHKLCDLNKPIVIGNKWQNNIEDFK